MNKKATAVVRIAPFFILGILFIGFGIFLRNRLPWDEMTGIHGLDYGIHGFKFAHYSWIGEMSFRHPLLGFLTAPITLFGQRFHELGAWPYWIFLFVVFSAFMVWAVALIHSILVAAGAGRGAAVAGTCLFVSFSYTWILAACPESFPIACVGLLLVLRWGLMRSAKEGPFARWGWLALALLNGGITLTHGLKVTLAYFVVRGFTWRRALRVLAILGGVVALFLTGMAVRYLLFNLTHAEGKANLSDGVVNSFLSFSRGLDWNMRIKLIINFFVEPIITHGDDWQVNHLVRPYGNWLAPCAVGGLYLVSLGTIVLRWRMPLVRMVLVLASVDFVLHVVCFWGMEEGHIYCGHWLFAPALLAALLPTAIPSRWRTGVLLALYALAGIIFLEGAKRLLC